MKSVGLNLTESWKKIRVYQANSHSRRNVFLLFYNKISINTASETLTLYHSSEEQSLGSDDFFCLRSHKILTRLSGVSQTDSFLLKFCRRICTQTFVVVGGTQPTGENCLPRKVLPFFKATGCLNYLKAMFVVLIQPFKFWLEGISKTEVECLSLISLSLTSFTFKRRVL